MHMHIYLFFSFKRPIEVACRPAGRYGAGPQWKNRKSPLMGRTPIACIGYLWYPSLITTSTTACSLAILSTLLSGSKWIKEKRQEAPDRNTC